MEVLNSEKGDVTKTEQTEVILNIGEIDQIFKPADPPQPDQKILQLLDKTNPVLSCGEIGRLEALCLDTQSPVADEANKGALNADLAQIFHEKYHLTSTNPDSMQRSPRKKTQPKFFDQTDTNQQNEDGKIQRKRQIKALKKAKDQTQ